MVVKCTTEYRGEGGRSRKLIIQGRLETVVAQWTVEGKRESAQALTQRMECRGSKRTSARWQG